MYAPSWESCKNSNKFSLLLPSVLEWRPVLKPEQLRRTPELMDRSVSDRLVPGYVALVGALKLPDPGCRVGLISLPVLFFGRFRPIILA